MKSMRTFGFTAALLAGAAASVPTSALCQDQSSRIESVENADIRSALERLASLNAMPELFDFVLSSEPRQVITVLGKYDIGLRSEDLSSDEAVSQAVTDFALLNFDAFNIDPQAQLSLKHTYTTAPNKNQKVFHYTPYAGSVEIADSEITAVLFPDGTLQSLNGPLRQAPLISTPATTLDAAVAAGNDALQELDPTYIIDSAQLLLREN